MPNNFNCVQIGAFAKTTSEFLSKKILKKILLLFIYCNHLKAWKLRNDI